MAGILKRTAIPAVLLMWVFIATVSLQAQMQQPNNYPTGQSNYPQNYPQQPENYPNASPSQSPQTYPQNGIATIPSGTQISIRTDETIDTTQPQTGATYPAQIAKDVNGPNGALLIPQGSPAQLTVQNTGKSTLGGNEMALALQSVTVNGRTYMVNSNTQNQSAAGGIGANKRTGEYIGGGALLGTLVGAIAGGGKGAIIGGILGAGGGAATQVLTRGNQIKVPAESVLTFRLDQPLQLQ